ncbi:hypothetical protein N7492_008742 [Penicillium capsulatum]|uniref:Microbial-type PARG catalytic domain-containing protein n=1 Tax=Penicillium capsulatum TaxID=69766 RepID=A0A9W9LH30_9EURO|nr:hypothetical protein N7492_008742 [Penicillium capsulatum]KAJ6106146.1 hypothetical protein N7512_009663 [Penicillium capsulatum]
MSRPSPPNKLQRQALAEETRDLIPGVIGATINPPTDHQRPTISVWNSDSFTAAETILRANPTARIGVLNMASERHPGGGWLRGALAQEEALCFRSTLARTLHMRYYPLPQFGAIWSPQVTVFRGEVSSWCQLYAPAEMFTVGVVSLPALRRPALTPDKKEFANPGTIHVVKDKIRQVLRVLATNHVTHCVLGAMGCGAFQNPVSEVVRAYKEVLDEAEWNGAFEEIVFAVLDTRGESNHEVFKDMLEENASSG